MKTTEPFESPDLGPQMILPPENNSVHIKTKRMQYNIHNVYLYEFGEPKELTNVFELINNADGGDIIHLRLNNPGGYLDSGIQLISTFQGDVQADIIMHIEAPLYSMAALFATRMMLLGYKTFIAENSYLMFHNYSGGASGKGNEMYDRLIHDKRWYKRFFEKCTMPFLTQEEVDRICLDKDLYVKRDDIIKRMKRVSKEVKK